MDGYLWAIMQFSIGDFFRISFAYLYKPMKTILLNFHSKKEKHFSRNIKKESHLSILLKLKCYA
jgi:hypothetical protein